MAGWGTAACWVVRADALAVSHAPSVARRLLVARQGSEERTAAARLLVVTPGHASLLSLPSILTGTVISARRETTALAMTSSPSDASLDASSDLL